jgi:hypothetical protein
MRRYIEMIALLLRKIQKKRIKDDIIVIKRIKLHCYAVFNYFNTIYALEQLMK